MVNKVSNWWYLVPLTISLIGGIVAYFAIRPRDKNKAKNLLYVGIAVFILHLTAQGFAIGLNLVSPLSFLMN